MDTKIDSDMDPVAEESRCPCCGERRIDELIWIDDETVECQSCKAWYDPSNPSDYDPTDVAPGTTDSLAPY